MGFFNKFKKKESINHIGSVDRVSVFDTDYPIDKSNWMQVFSACLGKVMAIQNTAAEHVVAGRDWNVDFSKGIISFGNDAFPAQFIGSESISSDTWLWGWENVNRFPDNIIELTSNTKILGEKWTLEPLTTPEFHLDNTFNGHTLSQTKS